MPRSAPIVAFNSWRMRRYSLPFMLTRPASPWSSRSARPRKARRARTRPTPPAAARPTRACATPPSRWRPRSADRPSRSSEHPQRARHRVLEGQVAELAQPLHVVVDGGLGGEADDLTDLLQGRAEPVARDQLLDRLQHPRLTLGQRRAHLDALGHGHLLSAVLWCFW